MSFTIEQWCQRHNVSRSFYYKLKRAGKAPRTMELLDKAVRITEEADREWVCQREVETLETV